MTRAQALLAVSYLATQEATEIDYAWPRPSEDEQEEAARLAALADQAHEDATAEGATEDDWAAMLDWLRGPLL
jgi:hypothetical protein